MKMHSVLFYLCALLTFFLTVSTHFGRHSKSGLKLVWCIGQPRDCTADKKPPPLVVNHALRLPARA